MPVLLVMDCLNCLSLVLMSAKLPDPLMLVCAGTWMLASVFILYPYGVQRYKFRGLYQIDRYLPVIVQFIPHLRNAVNTARHCRCACKRLDLNHTLT